MRRTPPWGPRPRGAMACRLRGPALVAVACAAFGTSPVGAEPSSRFSDVIRIDAGSLTPFNGVALDRLALFACGARARGARTGDLRPAAAQACRPIPFQIDERDAEGRWVLDQGTEPNTDTPPNVLDPNDLLLFMAADAGQRARRGDFSARSPVSEIAIRDPLGVAITWAYLLAYPEKAPRADASYVEYDPATDRVRGAHVALGFRAGVPNYLGLLDGTNRDTANLLDRFKVRATATLLWGLLRFTRSEDDLTTQFVAWHAGPIRVIRCQRQWVRLGWGIRSPTFGSYTYFHRDFAELPVGLRLNFAATYFFGDITIRALLDFRDLSGWSVLVPTLPVPLPIDGTMSVEKDALNLRPASWFALLGPRITLVQTLDVSPSLASVRQRLFYREDGAALEPPEEVPGGRPAIGYQLDRWEHVRAGAHQLTSNSYALPVDVDVRQFMASRAAPLQVKVRTLP